MQEQKLPAVEPGHESPLLKLPRVEGVGVKDPTPESEYPKMIPHPIHGQVKALSAEHEALLVEQIAKIPAPEPADEDLDVLHIENLLKRKLTGVEKAFVLEVGAAIDSKEEITPFDDEDAHAAVLHAEVPPESEEEPDEVIIPVAEAQGSSEPEPLKVDAPTEEPKAEPDVVSQPVAAEKPPSE